MTLLLLHRYHSSSIADGVRCNARSRSWSWLPYGLTLTLFACAGAATFPQPAPARGRAVAPHAAAVPAPVRVPTTIVTPDAAFDVEELFLSGQTALRQGDYARAVQLFDRIVEQESDASWLEHALFQGALAHEALGDLEGGAQRFEQLGRRFPKATLAAEALVRSMRLRLHREEWPQAGETARIYLERHPTSGPAGRIVAYAARGLELLAVDRQTEAEYFIAKGMQVVDQLELDRAGRIPRDLAQLYFALGEARRHRAEQARLSPDVKEFSARLERRCELLLEAQSAYSDSMRAYDAHWSTMAGYRVGELYERLHEELMQIPPPRTGTERERLLFEGAMRLRYSVLLDKAASMLEHTLAMAQRTGEQSEWVRRTEQSQHQLEASRQAEERALNQLPFSRAELERALDDLAARSRP
jgi:tetratricopeptide (TPR) repeat protein